jgi:hypothetical protein
VKQIEAIGGDLRNCLIELRLCPEIVKDKTVRDPGPAGDFLNGYILKRGLRKKTRRGVDDLPSGFDTSGLTAYLLH